MNNEAFQKLVRAGVKTSKEIAREAVLEEAHRKGKRGRGRNKNNDDYSSDEDYSNKKGKKKQRQQQQVKEMALDSEEEERLAELSEKYRDRAKERREGRAAGSDHVAAAAAAATTKSASETIFDDVVEALETGNRQKLAQLRTRTDEHEEHQDEYHPPSTPQEALDWINNNARGGGRARPPTSELGKEMLRFLKQQYAHASTSMDYDNDTATVSAAGQRLQQSILTFRYCLDNLAIVGNHCWEPPTERTYAAADTSSTATAIPKGTDCPSSLLATMERSLQRMHQKEQKQQHTKQSSSKKGKSGKEKPVGETFNPGGKEEDEAAHAAENGSKSEDEDDDDDDIFGGVGDYDGATAIQEGGDDQEDAAGIVEKKGSIFGDESTTKTSTQAKVTFASSASAQETTITSTRLVGFASLNNDDNEDDGIGMDFDGRDYEDDDDRKKKKKKKRKKGSDDDSDDD